MHAHHQGHHPPPERKDKAQGGLANRECTLPSLVEGPGLLCCDLTWFLEPSPGPVAAA
jgi:hypothetical protein